jgi:hypothetical protein
VCVGVRLTYLSPLQSPYKPVSRGGFWVRRETKGEIVSFPMIVSRCPYTMILYIYI